MKFTEHELLASIVRESFYDFLQEFWDEIIEESPVLNWHIEVLCEELQTMAERVFKSEPKKYDLVINVPPGSTKSTICSQMFPAWVWTRMPSAKFICASYAHQISLKDALKMRDIVLSEKYQKCFPGITLREDENAKGLFTNNKTGFRFSTGILGKVTGYHGHFLIVDDPLDPEQSYSEPKLLRANRWMSTTLPSRKVDKQVTPLILIQQRLHQSDPSGELLERSLDKGTVRHICLPGEIIEGVTVSPPELASRYLDNLLDPIRLPKDVLLKLETEELGAYGYASQILQSPVPLGGAMFAMDKVMIVDELPRRVERLVRSWDKAGTQDGGAWSVGVKMAIDVKGYFWIVDVVRGQWGSTMRESVIREIAEDDGEDIPILLEIEGGSGGKESGESSARNLAGYRVITYHPTGDKEARAYPFSSMVGSGMVGVLNRPWTRALIEEMRFFPRSKYKDQVDAGSAAFTWLARKKKRVGGAWRVDAARRK